MPLLTAGEVAHALHAAGVGRRDPVAVVVVAGAGAGLASERGGWAVRACQPSAVLTAIETACAPRWVWWSARGTAAPLVAAGVYMAACWDLAAVHRVLHGGRRDDPGALWAAARGLPPPAGDGKAARGGQLDLLAAAEDAADGEDPDEPVRGDGQLRRDWADETWTRPGRGDPAGRLRRAARFAQLALVVRAAQERALRQLDDPRTRAGGTRTAGNPQTPADGTQAAGGTPLAVLTAWAESAAELLACELERDGLPLDRTAAQQMIARAAGLRPRDDAEEAATRRARDAPVLAHLGGGVDLRNPAELRAALLSLGIDVPDTRSARLKPLRDVHPVVSALLTWRKAERIATTYGYRWLDSYVGPDGRLRGGWRGSDGAGGRMTAQAGLHNLPAGLRVAVAAEPGHRIVRADLGQIEPRVLAAVSGDPALARAAGDEDMYAPVAARLGCDRPTAKVAVLAAMYGQTSGVAGAALRQMRQAYPRAIAYLDAADAAGRAGLDLRTFGGRLIRTAPSAPAGSAPAGSGPTGSDRAGSDRAGGPQVDTDRSAAARGRFARNAVIQGAAAELFKAWAVTVRQELLPLSGTIVLCLHDELLLHVPADRAEDAVLLTHRTLAATAAYWAAGSRVRFVADVSVIDRWSDAKN
ncbi:DNA polymerase [Protofrankia symbiont of Coriaria ruscifolia]|uniref:DNA polymerase n=1 Tax=Protofrankia symbiont of Coriaria ruscifolia TaxID=1306542 RepID=UPI003D6CF3A0